MKKFNQNILFIITLVTSSLFFMGCYLNPAPQWSDVSTTPTQGPLKVGESFIFTGTCNYGNGNHDYEYVSIYQSPGLRSEVLSRSESGVVTIAFYGVSNNNPVNTANIACVGKNAFTSGAAYVTVQRIVLNHSSILPTSSNQSPIPVSVGDEQVLTIKLPKPTYGLTGVSFKLNESNSGLKFIDNKNTCQITYNTDSCSVTVIAESPSVSIQSITATTSGYPPETAYISIQPTSISLVPTSSSDSPLVIESGEEQTLTVKLPKAKTGTTTATFNITGSNPVIKFANDINTCQIISPSESCSISIIGESASATIQHVTATVDGYNPESAYIRVDKSEKYIFVSNAGVSGNLGGFSGADNICNTDSMLDTYPMLKGHTYKALLDGNAATKIGKSYYNINNQLIKVATSVNLTEDGGTLDNEIGVGLNAVYVWTGFARTSEDIDASNCNNWSSNNSGINGTVGYASVVTPGWKVTTSGGGIQSCDTQLNRLYCVQQ